MDFLWSPLLFSWGIRMVALGHQLIQTLFFPSTLSCSKASSQKKQGISNLPGRGVRVGCKACHDIHKICFELYIYIHICLYEYIVYIYVHSIYSIWHIPCIYRYIVISSCIYVCSYHTCIDVGYNIADTNIFSKVCSHMILPSPWHVVLSAVFDLSMKNQQK